jgi:hypothetical protein
MRNVELAQLTLGIWYRHREELYNSANVAYYDSTRQMYIQAALKFKTLGLIAHDRILLNRDEYQTAPLQESLEFDKKRNYKYLNDIVSNQG